MTNPPHIFAFLTLLTFLATGSHAQVYIAEYDGSAQYCSGVLFRTWAIPSFCVASRMEGDYLGYAFAETNPIQVYKCPSASCIKSQCTPIIPSGYQDGQTCLVRFYESTQRGLVFSSQPLSIPFPFVDYVGYSDDVCANASISSTVIRQRASTCVVEPSWGQIISTTYSILNGTRAQLVVYDGSAFTCGNMLSSQTINVGVCSSVGYTALPFSRRYVAIQSSATMADLSSLLEWMAIIVVGTAVLSLFD